MAVLKHIASKNADYGEAINYLLFQHNEKNGKPILDEMGRMVLRTEYYMDGILCDPMNFDHECQKTNEHFQKNQKFNEIKSHHYIISFDPRDVEDHGLTGDMAQQFCLDFAKTHFPGHQALVVTHTDGHNASGNIHTHIVINSVRKLDVEKDSFAERECDRKAGYKHHLTKDYLHHLEKSVMEMCEQNGFHQVDLLNPAPVKITQSEYWAKHRGQKRLEKTNEEIIADGLKPRNTKFKTGKQKLRDAIDDIAKTAISYDHFSELLMEKYEIEVRYKRGRFGYRAKGSDRYTTEKALGTQYGSDHLFEIFEQNKLKAARHETDYHKNPYAIFYFKFSLRLVVDLQNCVKAQNPFYAQKVKITNLQQMAETLIYVQDHNYDTRAQMKNELSTIRGQLDSEQKKLSALQIKLRDINEQIHYTGQYYANRKFYQEMLHAPNKALFRKEHESEIAAFEETRKYLTALHPDKNFTPSQELKERKAAFQELIKQQKISIQEIGNQEKELQIASENVDAILDQQPVQEQKKLHEEELS